MAKIFLAIAAILAGLGVAAGAFGAHALKDQLTEKALATFETGVKYQMYHALALFGVAILLNQVETVSTNLLTTTGIAFIVGIAIFSGSLYALSFTGIKIFGAITPIGGVALLVGWGCLAGAALKGL
ncbi:MAG: DUF423 domain-containing protein [Spirulina sp. SIO3F2]|nr:DUF423 domain-containing protein [Spirulina sp. SIO3F2]